MTIFADGQKSLFIPKSEWTPFRGPLPRLKDIMIGLDTETKDGGLASGSGPGWAHKDGYVCGVSVAWEDQSIYVPINHPETECRSKQEVIEWVEYLFRNCIVCFFNISYDCGWLFAEGCRVWPERAEDGGTMAFLIDENHKTYNLDDCCARAGILGKDETLLKEGALSYGVVPDKNGNIKHGIYRMPGRFVGPYAETDASSTLKLCKILRPILEKEGTMDAYRTEMNLFPVTNDMRWRGIRISTTGAEQAIERVKLMEIETLDSIPTPWRKKCTIDDLRSPVKLAELFDDAGVDYPRTLKTNQPSFKKEWLEQITHPLGKKVRRAKQLHDLHDKFIKTYILENQHRGRIHAEIRQLRAVTHRFSYSNPPLQQMPSRDEILAPLVRGIFLPEDDAYWLAADFKSQEPRLTVHYAFLSKKPAMKLGIGMNGIDEAVRYYREDPNPDPHQLAANLLNRPRRVAKDLNLGLTYRMGHVALAGHLNLSEEEAEELWNAYHEKIQYVSGISKYAESMAKKRGYIKMIDGALRHYPLWQPKNNRKENEMAYLEEAQQRWPNQPLERAFAYQAGNSLIQGSAARQTKIAMVDMHRAGFKPLIQMHDEIDVSVENAKQCKEIGEIMVEAVTLVIPVTADLEVGTTWGNAKKIYTEVFK